MTTETAEATADTAQTDTASTSSTETTKEVTLDDVYRDAGLDKLNVETRPDNRTETPAKVETPAVDPASIPDPYDTDKYKAHQAAQASRTATLEQAVRGLTGFLTAQQQAAALAATKADIESAVSKIEETVQVGKPKLIEAYLDGEVRSDPRMKALWDNRTKNPVAWSKAVDVVAKKMQKEFDLKVDPALAAAQRARKEGQRTMATTAPEDTTSPVEQTLAKAQGADFNREWERLVSGGN